MWLVIEGKIFDPSAEPNTTISAPDSSRYIPIAGANLNINAKDKTFKPDLLIFVGMPEH